MHLGATRQRGNAPAGRILRTIHTGSSGAAVHIIEYSNGRRIAVKVATTPRVTAIQQREARRDILPLFGRRLPDVLFAGSCTGRDVLIAECPSVRTLADEVAAHGPTDRLMGTWCDITATLTRVWSESAQPGFSSDRATRSHLRRLHRGVAGLEFASRAVHVPLLATQRVRVNGKTCDSWNAAHGVLGALRPPIVRVACHGDPQPANILVDAVYQWYLIDWEWSGRHHDWRMMISHLIGWWYVNDILRRSHGDITMTAARLDLAYEPPDIQAIRPWAHPVATAFNAMTDAHRDERDLSAVALHTALLLLREIPRAAAHGSRHLLAPLFGEALDLIHSTRRSTPHPLMRLLISPREGALSRR